MPGTILSHFLPFRVSTVLFGLYDYLLPIMLYCAWSTLVLLDLARAGDVNRGRTVRWALAVLALPVVGAAAYLLFGKSTIGRSVRLGVVAGGLIVVLAAYGYTMVRIS